MKNILIYTNFDEASQNAIYYGIDLALKENFSVEILHVVNTAYFNPDFSVTGDSLTNDSTVSTAVTQSTYVSKIKFRELTEDLKKRYPRLPEIRKLLKAGIDRESVIEETSHKDTFMLILPGHYQSEFLDFITDISSTVISHARCPVMIVPEDAKYRPFQRIVYATDFVREDITSMQALKEIASPVNATIIAAHLTSNKDFVEKIEEEGFKELIKQETGYNNISMEALDDKNIESSLLKFSKEVKADMIAVLKDNKNFFEKIFEKNTVKSIIKKSAIPVLIFHKLKEKGE